jgi:chromosome partitioning protein
MADFVLSVLNAKGGCQKSTTCLSLAGCFAQRGRRVLVCDLDPQGNLTNTFVGPSAADQLPKTATVAAAFDDSLNPTPNDLICPTAFANIAILPSGRALADYNLPRPHETGRLQHALREFLADARSAFDVALIDCPPSLQLCSWAALLASDFVLVPVQCEDFGAQGLIRVQEVIEQVRTTHNRRLRLLGYLMAMYQPRLAVHIAYAKTLRQMYGSLVLETAIPLVAHFKEAVASRQPVTHYKPRSAAAKAVGALADELLARMAHPQQEAA